MSSINFEWKRTCVIGALLAAWIHGSSAIGQETEEPELVPGESVEEGAPAPEDVPQEAPENLVLPPLSGDVIYLKFGAPMSGVQVIRSTPRFYEIETAPGVPPLQLLRKLVDRVEYDDIDPIEQRRLREQKAAAEESVVSGEQLAPELRAKLTQLLGDQIAPFVDRDLVEVLTDLAAKTNVALEIGESVQAMPPAERLWSVETVEGLTLLSLLQEQLRPRFPQIRIEFHFDKVALIVPPSEEVVPAPETPPDPATPPESPF